MKRSKLQKLAAKNLAQEDQLWACIRELRQARKISAINIRSRQLSGMDMALMRLCTMYVQHKLLSDCDEKIKDCFR